MSKNSEAQGLYSLENAARKLLKGLNAAEQPIKKEKPLKTNPASINETNKPIHTTENTQSIDELLQFAHRLSNCSIDKLLKHAQELGKNFS